MTNAIERPIMIYVRCSSQCRSSSIYVQLASILAVVTRGFRIEEAAPIVFLRSSTSK
jgi:hypothetical protein